MQERAFEPFVRIYWEDSGANLGFCVAMAESGITIGRLLLMGEQFVIAGSSADPLVHNREREPSHYGAKEVLLYPLNVDTATYLYDR